VTATCGFNNLAAPCPHSVILHSTNMIGAFQTPQSHKCSVHFSYNLSASFQVTKGIIDRILGSSLLIDWTFETTPVFEHIFSDLLGRNSLQG
jgi:hypothetical protein